MTVRDVLDEILSKRLLVLDGAMGTMIQRHRLEEADFRGERFASHSHDLKGDNDVLVLTQPGIIGDIHRQYLAAGADIIETNTFNANAISQADYALESACYDVNLAGAQVARAAAAEFTAATPDKPRFVAGSIGPSNRTLSIPPDVNNPSFRGVTFDALKDAYVEQVRGLVDGGVDLILLETFTDTLNAKAAIVAVQEVEEATGIRLPLIVSATLTDTSGRVRSGQTLDAFYSSVEHARPWCVGLNCALGARAMRPFVAELARVAGCWVSCYPSAGLPNAVGEYDEKPDEMAALIRDLAESSLVNIVGGCCGTTPDHIVAIVNAVASVKPRRFVGPGRGERPILSIADARANHLKTDWDTLEIPVPWFIGRRIVEPSLEELIPFIDWTFFFPAWELKGRFPAILDHPDYGGPARELYENAQTVLARIVKEKRLTARGVYGFWPANAIGDDIAVYKDDARQKGLVRFHMLRQQEPIAEKGPNRSLADFIAPRESLAPDYIGAFAATAGIGADDLANEYERQHDDYNAIIVKAIAERLAEAFAEYLHAQARQDWGYGKGEKLSAEDLIEERYRGIRPAFGYPACPDHSEKPDLFALLDAPAIGISLTESNGMIPAASVSGLYFSHPQAKYFNVGRIGRDQLEDYAKRRGVSVEQAERWLAPSL